MQSRNVDASLFNYYKKLKRYILSAKLFKIIIIIKKKHYTCQSTQGGVSTQVVLNDALGGEDFSCVDLKNTQICFSFSHVGLYYPFCTCVWLHSVSKEGCYAFELFAGLPNNQTTKTMSKYLEHKTLRLIKCGIPGSGDAHGGKKPKEACFKMSH